MELSLGAEEGGIWISPHKEFSYRYILFNYPTGYPKKADFP